MNTFMQGILVGILIYSSVVGIVIVLVDIFDWEEDMTLAIVSGPIGWIICFIIHAYYVKQDEIRKKYERNKERKN